MQISTLQKHTDLKMSFNQMGIIRTRPPMERMKSNWREILRLVNLRICIKVCDLDMDKVMVQTTKRYLAWTLYNWKTLPPHHQINNLLILRKTVSSPSHQGISLTIQDQRGPIGSIHRTWRAYEILLILMIKKVKISILAIWLIRLHFQQGTYTKNWKVALV